MRELADELERKKKIDEERREKRCQRERERKGNDYLMRKGEKSVINFFFIFF